MRFIPLHCHSVFSFHAGVCSVQELVRRAKTLGLPALALTDTNRMSGLILFYLECKAQGINPILGVELTEPNKPFDNLVLLAKNSTGYSDLCEIITQRHLEASSFSFKTLFQKEWPHLFFLTHSPDYLHLLSRTPNRASLYAELINNSPATRARSRELEKTARELGLPLVAANNSFFLDKEDWETHRVLAAIGLNSTLSRLKPEEFAGIGALFASPEEMEKRFPRHPEALANTQRIASLCRVELKLNEWIMPAISAPQGHTPDSYLAKIALEGLRSNYDNTPAFNRALGIQNMELEVIRKLGYSSYFLMVKEIRDWANARLKTKYRRPKDCTILRGSAANSLTFFNIGVSDLDPIKYNLYFQRFLNEDRASPPDADLDFGWDERDAVLTHVAERFGRDRVAITCTTNHFQRRAAFRETAKVFGYSEEQVSEVLDSFQTKESRISDDEIQQISAMAAKIKGKPRFLGQHPGGVLITNDPICRHVACEYSGGEKNRIVTQIDMHNGIDELGLIKFDLLGNGSLSVLRDTLQQLEEQGFPDPKVWDLEKCYADPKVQEAIAKGKTRGIFYIESPAQIRLNQKAQARTFEEITITSSLVRPAGAKYTQVFVERHRKEKLRIRDWDFLHPSLAPFLEETHDVLAFQEDVTKVCHHVAGLSYKKADKVRKMMNSLHDGILTSDEWATTSREFIEGCRQQSGLTLEQAVELWERVSSFTGFSFCKSHSASYAQLSFQCTYLKTHYPAQFLSSVISNNHGFYTRDVYLNEARRWGVRILPLHINESAVKYHGKQDWIRPGLLHVRNLSQKAMDNIILERGRGGRFCNLADFIRRVDIHKKEIDNLIRVGAFDGFGLSRPELLFFLDSAYRKLRPEEPELFTGPALPDLAGQHPDLCDYTFMQKCLNELELLGYMISGNILDILALHAKARDATPLLEAPRYTGRRIKVFGRPITERIHVVMPHGKPMKFLTLEDASGCMDVIFWPDRFEQYSDILLSGGPFEIWGKVTQDWDTHCLEADSVKPAAWTPNQIDFSIASKKLEHSYRHFKTYDDIPQIRAA